MFKHKREELKQECNGKDEKFLLELVVMVLFHAHLLLLKSDEYIGCKQEYESEKARTELLNYFVMLLQSESSLSSSFCLDILSKYRMFDEAIMFLFYRKEYEKLLHMIRKNYEKAQAKVNEILSVVRSSQGSASS